MAKLTKSGSKYRYGKTRYSLEELLANPRLRSKLPDSKLPAHLLAQRKENTRKKASAGPGSSMTVGDMETMLKTQFGSAEAALAQRKKEIPEWYAGYKAQLMGMALSQGGQQAAAQQSFENMKTASANNAAQANGQANAQTAQANQISGGGAAAAAAQDKAAAQQRGAETVRQGQVTNNQELSRILHDNQYAFLQRQNDNAMQMENVSQGDLLKLQQALSGKKSEAYQSILSDERKAKLENFIANNNASDDAADNALDKKKYSLDKSDKRTKNQIARDRLALDRQKAADKAANKGKPKPITDAKRTSNNSDYQKAQVTAKTLMSEGKMKDMDMLISYMSAQYPNMDVNVLKGAAFKVRKRKITGSLRKQLKAYGIKL